MATGVVKVDEPQLPRREVGTRNAPRQPEGTWQQTVVCLGEELPDLSNKPVEGNDASCELSIQAW